MALDGDTSFDNDMVWKATRHFTDPTVFCVAGCLRVRNAFKNLVTRLQAVEYFISIHAGKSGMSEFNIVNNISGAFGVFRKSIIDAIIGWDAGTAEDLDLTIRIKNYFGRYKWIKVKFDNEAVGHTDVPETWSGLFRQRRRWDGDMPFIYLKKHSKSFAPGIMGYKNFSFLILSGLLFQIIMPFMIILYLTFVLFVMPFYNAVALFLLMYVFYVFVGLATWIFAILLVSERQALDLKMTGWVLLLPFYSLLIRLNSAFATLWDLVGKGHEDTSMAPWWTTKKSKFH
jgi:cellulose synthase/poly-beta-1,6-N-acetylglucosamine synthase-like glycosyltransferase